MSALVNYPVDDPAAAPSLEVLVEHDSSPIYPLIFVPYIGK